MIENEFKNMPESSTEEKAAYIAPKTGTHILTLATYMDSALETKLSSQGTG